MAITFSPDNPVAGETVTVTVTDGAGNATTDSRLNLTAKPNTSALSTGMAQNAAGEYLLTLTPDVAGEYSITATQYDTYAIPPAFSGDPAGEQRTLLIGTQTATMYVGNALVLPVATTLGDGVSIRLVVHGTDIKAASMVDTIGELGRQCALDTTVLAAVAALVNEDIVDIAGNLYAEVSDLQTKHTAHIATGATVHSAADAVNTLAKDPPTNIGTAISALDDVADKLQSHQLSGAAVTTWHATDDSLNTRVAAKALDVAGARVLCTDLRHRVYERHRAQISAPASHGTADVTNVLTGANTLDDAIVAILDYLASASPTAAPQENDGATLAIARYGFKPFIT